MLPARLDRQLRKDLVERLLHLRFATRIGQVGDRLSLEQRIDGRDRLDLELRGDELFLVDIDLPEDHALVGIFRRDLFEHRRERLARAAPFGMEIEDDELRHRRFDNLGLEAFDRFLFIHAQTHARHVNPPFVRKSRLPHVGIRTPM